MKIQSRHTFEVFVSGMRIDVHFVDEFPGREGSWGYACYRTREIHVALKDGNCPFDTYFHELFHWWFYLAGRGGRDFTHQLNDEMLASMAAAFMSDIFRCNDETMARKFAEEWVTAMDNKKNAKCVAWVEV